MILTELFGFKMMIFNAICCLLEFNARAAILVQFNDIVTQLSSMIRNFVRFLSIPMVQISQITLSQWCFFFIVYTLFHFLPDSFRGWHLMSYSVYFRCWISGWKGVMDNLRVCVYVFGPPLYFENKGKNLRLLHIVLDGMSLLKSIS